MIFAPENQEYFEGSPLATLHLKYGASLRFQQVNWSIYGVQSPGNFPVSTTDGKHNEVLRNMHYMGPQDNLIRVTFGDE